MAVKVEAFLDLEASLHARLYNAWKREQAGEITQIAKAADAGDFQDAYDRIAKVDTSSVFEKQARYIALVGMQAMLYGAANFASPKQTRTYEDGRPDALDTTTALLIGILSKSMTESLKRYLVQLVAQQESDQTELLFKGTTVRKAGTENFVRDFQSSVDARGSSYINFGASLHTSRLGVWGFLTEARFREITTYQVSEQLDSRTCPVCQMMHGKTFEVATAYTRIEEHLAITDPDEIAAVARWPSQSKAGVETLRNMSADDIVANGWDTPPYHPRCRGVLRSAGSVSDIVDVVRQPLHRPVEQPLEQVRIDPGLEPTVQPTAPISPVAPSLAAGIAVAPDPKPEPNKIFPESTVPLPTPNANETEQAFMDRCMGFLQDKDEFKDSEQRAAVCYSQYSKARKQDGEKDPGAFTRALQNLLGE